MEPTILETVTTPKLYPTISDRIQSGFVDAVLIIVLMLVATSVLDRYEAAPDWIRIALFFGVWAVYEPLCTSLGCTLGNYMKGIRVRRSGNEAKRINFFAAFVRYGVKLFLGWISFVTMHFNPQRRAIHDYVAGSVMVKVD
jgi:uncharacterized RDD family membrane protein YckC